MSDNRDSVNQIRLHGRTIPHTQGDGIVDGSEECDHGADNGKDGSCSSACKSIIYLTP
jgi:hypothetical protein